MAMKALVPVADGVEDIETVTVVDVLRRARVDVTVASIGPSAGVTCARGCRLTADCTLAEAAATDYDLIVVPGGAKGAENLSQDRTLVECLRRQKASGRWFAAICAAPALVLAHHHLTDDLRTTCYPSFRDRLAHPSDERVVVDGNCITSQSPATAMAFALKLVELLCGAQTSREVAAAMLFAA
ncbi:MAG TPA: DJ-1 family glyoxalase III [Candidatus Binatia bacterium]|nr:DJ-1 family glyoxalase III [Candidatus Binatia bacterium]